VPAALAPSTVHPGGNAAAGPAATAFHPGFVLSQFGRDTWYLSRLNGRAELTGLPG